MIAFSKIAFDLSVFIKLCSVAISANSIVNEDILVSINLSIFSCASDILSSSMRLIISEMLSLFGNVTLLRIFSSFSSSIPICTLPATCTFVE